MLCGGIGVAQAGSCPGNPNAIGTSRTIVVDPREHGRIGTMDYEETLPLADHEVVLTFDDGPLPPYTNQILKILADECVLANYFIVGEMAKAYPEALREVFAAGHTIGTHSWSHPLKFRAQSYERAKFQIDEGIAATAAALGDPSRVAPFFRFPGFGHTADSEEYLAGKGIMVWGADAPADDWTKISSSEIAKRAIRRLEGKGKGILLLHDIHARTVAALPMLLRELKERGFRIVHVVPASPERPVTETVASAWRLHSRPGPAAPVIMIASVQNLDAESLAKLNQEQLCALPEPEERQARLHRQKGVRLAHLHRDAKDDSKEDSSKDKPNREARLHRETKHLHESKRARLARLHRELREASDEKPSREARSQHESKSAREDVTGSVGEAPIRHAGRKHKGHSNKVAATIEAPSVPVGNSHAIQ
jgi:peptidoglycan/xylan/chitin deacetylase (PgdA/CDA1 family)